MRLVELLNRPLAQADTPGMRMVALAFVLAAALGTAACSAGAATDNAATMDAAATKACVGLYQLTEAQAGLSPRDLRNRVGQVYADASASANPVIRVRAVALFADATQMVEGADSGSLRADLAAMQLACDPRSS